MRIFPLLKLTVVNKLLDGLPEFLLLPSPVSYRIIWCPLSVVSAAQDEGWENALWAVLPPKLHIHGGNFTLNYSGQRVVFHVDFPPDGVHSAVSLPLSHYFIVNVFHPKAFLAGRVRIHPHFDVWASFADAGYVINLEGLSQEPALTHS